MSGAIRTVSFKHFFQNYIPMTRSMGLGAISNENRVKSFSEPVYKQPGSEVRQTPYRHFEAPPPATNLDKSNSEILDSQIKSNGFSRMLTIAMLYVGGTFLTMYLVRKDMFTKLNDTFQNSFYLMNKGNPGDGAGQGGRAEGEIISFILFG